jgi:iron complex outermembrane recepter protein
MITHPPSRSARAARRLSRLLRSAAIATVAAGALAPFPRDAAAADEAPDAAPVTGTHIRGSTDSAFPITIYTRDVIEASGATTLQEFIQKIPQNFNGGASETTIGSVTGGGNADNKVEATGVNLRGLGNDATLVLINGHRVAPGNTDGNFVDLSMIPLYAVERVEVVTDGASAIYGSDAVGGVVNIILGRNLDGAETRVRYGSVTSGSASEREVGQTVGHSWDTGSAQVIYDYLDRTPLNADSRSYTDSAIQPFMLLPEQVRHGVFFSVDDSVSDNIQLFAEGTYSHRSTDSVQTYVGMPEQGSSRIDAYSASTGARIDLPGGAQLELTGSYTASDTRNSFVFSTPEPLPESDEHTKSSILSIDAKLDGSAFSLPAGDVRYAVGTQFRREELDFNDLLGMTEFNPSRDVSAVFAEFRVPLLGPAEGTAAAQRLELTLADRLEHYSDFGSTNNPQVGIIWRPLADLKARATYGTSFHAPLLNDLNPVPYQVVPFPEPDPTTGGATNTLAVFGGNPDLKPEKARTWTAGLDFTPHAAPDFHASATYYNIRFTNVVADPEYSVDLADVLSEASILGPSIIQRNPSPAYVQQLASTPGYENPFGVDLASIGAIFDSRFHNLSIMRTSGLDLDGSWAQQTAIANIELGLNATYIFRFDTQFTSSAPAQSILNTDYNPVDLRLRARVIIRRGGLTFASFINFTNSYRDVDATPTVPIASWTTLDETVKYAFNSEHGPLADASLLLSVSNLLNRAPPYVANPTYGINFDGANANALGRFISVQLSKRW